MGFSGTALLPLVSEADIQALLVDIGLPRATSAVPLNAAADYHSIYILSFDSHPKLTDLSGDRVLENEIVELVLRVAGTQIPSTKTINEIASIEWVRKNTENIPVPIILRFDASTTNALKHEYTLMSKVSGISVDRIYNNLSQTAKDSLVEQLASIVHELHSHTWDRVGGLAFDIQGDIIPGLVVEETFWQTQDLPLWNDGTLLEDLNISGPFSTYGGYALAHLGKYNYMINKHSKLKPFRSLEPHIQALEKSIVLKAGAVNDVRYILAHRDLHFGNILCDPETCKITAVLDWEFAGVCPAFRWNPVRAFLWNCQKIDQSQDEKDALFQKFEAICLSSYPRLLEGTKPNKTQELVSTAINHLRAIIEVSVKGGAVDRISAWESIFTESVDALSHVA
ncbi:hypothetical protein BT63DRAFT_450591 [Microthyrium microscopicum]|uniref:Aminoglycoside phosphotransferase domain-containing protein n=1 Tax=Microthyrium microscopicum TaxID=703497 RepID=A0A6A6UJW7_9PEZI|nr:hypothetical protein BT63DRAFT_450591 [Microthyrium microscopicum]